MKTLLKLFWVLGVSLIALSFTACSDDDDDPKSTESALLEMKFDDDIVTVQPIITGTDIKFFVAHDATEQDLKEMVPAITVSNKATVSPAPGSKVDFSGDPVKFTVTAEDGVTKTVYTVTCEKGESPEAKIISVTFSAPVVVEQPTIDGTNIRFFVAADAADEDLKKLTPVIEISVGATIDPASGSPVDFSNGAVEFTVTSQDKANTTVYTVSYQRIGKYNFEEWIEEGIASSIIGGLKIPYYAPVGGWSSSNKGAGLLVLMGKVKQVVVTKTDDAHSGSGAAKIETILSNNVNGTGSALYPVVTTGSLFLGEFITNTSNTLLSTKFGIPYTKRPIAIKGYYKYTPGSDFYRCDIINTTYNKVTLEEGTTDNCSINAILYEYENDLPENPTTPQKEEYYAQFITGVDTYSFKENKKLVAVAKLTDGTAKAEYTAFQIEFKDKDGKTAYAYDPTKKYRMSIICSSSAEGDTFSGAPGSVLFVDDIEVISE